MDKMRARYINDRTTVVLTERELFLIKWSLDMMKYNIEGLILKDDIEKIRQRLTNKPINIDVEKN